MVNGIFQEINDLKSKIARIESLKVPYQRRIIEKENVISEYSNFNLDDFGYLLSYLMSKVEGDEYEYYNVLCESRVINFFTYDYEIENKNTVYHVVGLAANKKTKIHLTYVLPSLCPLEKDDNLIILDDAKEGDEKIRLFDHHGLKVDVKNRCYLNDFMIYLIDYKVKNGVLNLALDDMIALADSFVSSLKRDKVLVKNK